ncbi:MAG: hypothetical protein AAB451_03435 [Patescibacteria group bacterium]|mgnify:CR=1 FL=1
MPNKKVLIISLIVLPVFILAGLAVYFLNQKQTVIPSAGEKQEILAEKQLKELEALRQKTNIQPLTEEQKKSQQRELESLRKKANIKPLSQAQIQKQLEELDKLRLSAE